MSATNPSQKKLDCFFVSDLHGRPDRYEKLFEKVKAERPSALFIGGDLLPSPFAPPASGNITYKNFIKEFLVKELEALKERMGDDYPRLFVILGNDDARMEEAAMLVEPSQPLWNYCHNRRILWEGFTVYGYTFIPPSPFRLKDWERFDVTKYVRPGCISPVDGAFTIEIDKEELSTGTIEKDLEQLTGEDDLDKAILLFHSPPHGCNLDRAGLDGRHVDGVQVDVHVGSTAIQRFITRRQPLLTLHGHIHESTRFTGNWRDKFGRTESFNASHDGPELSLVRFDPHNPQNAGRELL